MPSIFTLPPLEEGGPIARGGFDYQDHVAVAFCLEMLRDATIQAVWCETHDDLLLDRVINQQHFVEFVQVKSDSLNQLWTVARLCERESRDNMLRQGSSIVEKQLARDRGDEQSLFRLVTFRDVHTELSLLKHATDQRNRDESDRLVVILTERLGNYVSPKQHGIHYWIRHMRWDVRESIHAIENSNLVRLDDYITTELHLPLLLRHKRDLYTDLVELMRRLAAARWADGAERKRISREEFCQWMVDRTSRFPAVIEVRQAQELGHLERESIARCDDRWRALGVPEDLALHLANDPNVGAPSHELLSSLERPFGWLVGDFGSGKSLTAERIYQRQLLVFREQATARIPVFLEGMRVGGRNLRDEAEARARQIGDITRRGILLLVDGIDQAGSESAIDLLSQASVLSRTWQNSSVIVTSTAMPVSSYEDAKITLPPLLKPTVIHLIQRISGNNIPSIHHLPQVFHTDITKPLFAVILAMQLRENQRMPDSIGELLANVANRAIQPLIRDFANARELLIRLAARSTDNGGGPVPAADIAASIHQLQPLIGTRLIAEGNGVLAFTVTTLAHWFAAEALSSNIVTAQELVANTVRRERWRYPLTIFVGTKNFDQVSNVLEPLVRAHPAFAAVITRDALHDWPRQSQDPMVPPQELASQMHRALLAWFEGVGPLARFVAPRNSRGELLKLSAYVNQGYVTVLWHDNPSLPPVQGRQGAPDYGSHSGPISSDIIGDQPAWIWKQTKGHIASDLWRLVQSRQLPNEVLIREIVWGEACERTVRSAMHDVRIPIDEILRAQSRPRFFHSIQTDLFQEEIGRLQQSGAQFLEAPYPQADREPTSSWITNYFSEQRILERARAVYSAALQTYEDLIRMWFPKFALRLRHFAMLPVRMHGILIPEASVDRSGRNPFSYRFEPLPPGSQNEVCLEIGSEQQARDTVILREEHLVQVRTLRPECAEWLGVFSSGGGLTTVCHNDPCTKIVYEWLESDLREVNWDH